MFLYFYLLACYSAAEWKAGKIKNRNLYSISAVLSSFWRMQRMILKIKDKGKILDTDALPVFPLPLLNLSGSGLDFGRYQKGKCLMFTLYKFAEKDI